MLENKVEDRLVLRVEAAGGLCLKLKLCSAVGWPDRTILLPGGRIAFAELKRPVGGRRGPLQGWWRATLQRLGFRCEFLKTFQEVEDFLCSL